MSDRIKLSLQMFNLIMGGDWNKDTSQSEAEALIEKIADAGFEGIELCGFMLNDAAIDLHKIKKQMDTFGLAASGYHFHLNKEETKEEDYRTAVDRCLALKCRYLIFAHSIPKMFGCDPDENGKYTPEQIDKWAVEADNVISKLKEASKDTDIKILYHNHADEFLRGSEGKRFIEMIHPDGFEYDVYWISKGLDGKVSSALQYIKSHKDQAVFLHIKDGLDGSVHTGEMCGWGKGTFKIQEIIDCAKELGIEWVINENDAPKNFGQTGIEDACDTGMYVKKYLKL